MSEANGAAALAQSVQVEAPKSTHGHTNLLVAIATVADDLTPWGGAWEIRDRQLREFWPTEPYLASAMYSVAAQDAALSWYLEGDPLTADAVTNMLNMSQFGEGWDDFIFRIVTDYHGTDNGAFIELIRATDSPESPVVHLAQLDSNRCVRTGRPEEPVIYMDRNGTRHMLKWHQVITLADMPSPIESMNGIGFCAVSRILRAAQVLRSLSIFEAEKLSGRDPKRIHVVGGIFSDQIEDAMRQSQQNADNMGMIRWIKPVIMGAVDPGAEVSVATIDLADIPEHFDRESALKWYIVAMALSFGRDYQDFAPLQSGSMGTAGQSTMLHLKSRGKGPGLWMKRLTHAFNSKGVVPGNVTFGFDEPDQEADKVDEEVRTMRWERLDKSLAVGGITTEVYRQKLNQAGDLTTEELEAMGTADVSDDQVATDTQLTDDTEGDPNITSDKAIGSKEEDLPDVRNEQRTVGRVTGDYQDEQVEMARSWKEDFARQASKMNRADATALLDRSLAELEMELVSLGEEKIPEGHVLGAGQRELDDQAAAVVLRDVQADAGFKRDNLIPFLRESALKVVRLLPE